MRIRTLVGATTALTLGAGLALATWVATPAQASAPAAPAAAVKTVTVCVTGPSGEPFAHNRVIALSGKRHHYNLRSAVQTGPDGCGEVAIGNSGKVFIRAVSESKTHVRDHVCKRTVFRTSWPVADAASIPDGATLDGQLKRTKVVLHRCA